MRIQVICIAACLAPIAVVGCRPPQDVANHNLFEALSSNSLEGVQPALSQGADPNAIDPNPNRGFTALEEAQSPAIISLLLKAGANPNKADAGGFLPLGMTAAAGKLDSVKLLLEAGARLEAKDAYGCTALCDAVSEGSLENAQFLFAKGANIDSVDKEGRTPLFKAVMAPMVETNARVAMVKWLIESGADVKIKDRRGRMAVDYAKTRLMKALTKSPEPISLLTPLSRHSSDQE